MEHTEKVVLVRRETGVAVPTDNNLWQVVQLITRAAIIIGTAFAKSLCQERLGRDMIAIAHNVGDGVAAMDAPRFQSIICKILDLTHLPISFVPLASSWDT
jgi:hypothetical protein